MRDNGGGASVKTIQHAVVHTLKSDVKLVNIIPKLVSFGAA